MMLDRLHNDLNVRRAISPVTLTNVSTAQVGQTIDLANRFACEFVIAIGALTDADATFAVLVEDDDAAGMGTAAAVADAFLLGTEALAAFTFADDDEVRKIGYIGPKRYVRITITPTGNNSGSATFSALALLTASRKRPHSSQES